MTVNTITVGAGTLVLGEVGSIKAFSSQVTAAKFVPAVDQEDPINVLSGEQVAGARTESFTLQGTLLQDFGTMDGLTEWCWTNRGLTVDFEYIPNTVGARGVRGQVQVEAMPIGGDVKAKPADDFEWQVIGTPELFDAEDAELVLGA